MVGALAGLADIDGEGDEQATQTIRRKARKRGRRKGGLRIGNAPKVDRDIMGKKERGREK